MKPLIYCTTLFIALCASSCEKKSFDRMKYYPRAVENFWRFSGPMQLIKIAERDSTALQETFVLIYGDEQGTVLAIEEYTVANQHVWLKSFYTKGLPKILYNPPLPTLPSSDTPGDSLVVKSKEVWVDSTEKPINTYNVTSRLITEGLEDVATSTAVFTRCIKVKQQVSYDDGVQRGLAQTNKFWWVDGIGMVKYENADGGGQLMFALINGKRFPN